MEDGAKEALGTKPSRCFQKPKRHLVDSLRRCRRQT